MKSLNRREVASMLFDQYGDEVYRYIRFSLGNKAEADDILQEVFLRVLQSWDNFNHNSQAKTWLWSITKNCMRDYFRKQKRASRFSPLVLREIMRLDVGRWQMTRRLCGG